MQIKRVLKLVLIKVISEVGITHYLVNGGVGMKKIALIFLVLITLLISGCVTPPPPVTQVYYFPLLIDEPTGYYNSDNYHALEVENGFIFIENSYDIDTDNSDLSVMKLDKSGNLKWHKLFGGSGDDLYQNDNETVIKTSAGDYLVTAKTNSTDGDLTDINTNLITGNKSIWVFKLSENSAGDGAEITWQKCLFPPNDGAIIKVLETAPGEYLLVGEYYQEGAINYPDVWIVKLVESGDEVEVSWEKTYGGDSVDSPLDAIVNSQGDYIIVGETASSDGDVPSENGARDAFVIKVIDNGNDASLVWARSFGGSVADRARKIIETSGGDYVIVGTTSSSDGDISGKHGIGSNDDVWLFKICDISTSASLVWQKCIGGENNDSLRKDVFETSDGSYVLCGTTYSIDGDFQSSNGESEGWIGKFKDNGSTVATSWIKTIGGTSYDEILSMKVLTDDSFVLVGSSESQDSFLPLNNGGSDILVLKVQENGTGDDATISWQKLFGGSDDDYGVEVLIASNTDFLVLGEVSSDDGIAQGNIYDWSPILILLDSNGNLK